MTCCCLDTISGAPPASGGAAALTSSSWTEVYRIDMVDEFASQGAIDLLPVSSTITIDGITWTSGSAVAAATSFGLTATGLRVVGPVSTVFTDVAQTAPHIWVDLGTLLPTGSVFEFCTCMEYRFEVFVSDQNGAADDEYAGVGFYTPTIAPPAATRAGTANPRSVVTGKGFVNGIADSLIYTRSPGVNLVERGDADVLALDVCSLQYQMTQNLVAHAGEFSGGDFGADSAMQPITGWRAGGQMATGYFGDPDFTRLAMVFSATNINGTFDATIEQFRILQK